MGGLQTDIRINLTLLYKGSQYLSSGLVAIVFSTIVIMNIINSKIFLGVNPSMRSIIGSIIGILGLIIVFWDELSELDIKSDKIIGLLIVVCATFSASLGNTASIRNQKNKIPVAIGNAFGMLYGAVFLIFFVTINGSTFVFDTSLIYISSLMYLSFFGSVLAFGFYLTLLGTIGAGKAAYANLLFPIVAVLISIIMKEQNFGYNSFIGIAFVLIGNYFMLIKLKTKN